MAPVLFEPQMNDDVADTVRTSRDSRCGGTNDVSLSVADDSGSSQSSPKLSAKACSKKVKGQAVQVLSKGRAQQSFSCADCLGSAENKHRK